MLPRHCYSSQSNAPSCSYVAELLRENMDYKMLASSSIVSGPYDHRRVCTVLNINDKPVARHIAVCLRLNIVQSQTCIQTGLSPRLRSERRSRKSQGLDGRIRNATGKESYPLLGKRFTKLLKTAKSECQRPPAPARSLTVRSMNDISLFLRHSFFAFPCAGSCVSDSITTS